ncbi:uncharacterized protein EI90DRAFT_3132445 [Cantharellus anzutake]|uniref:uncharacterized protein n=1 Tax=Cantharellus anzutake TaxID=1750568 RepID=UPI00190811DF|nr:uncharacterized protein EI90DRAFT_3132445 [Cantharellus anzutake]KAF8319572.1 hypothetical protein EI90DRAFT_3132445 [Cantharellus anzutake]
MPHPTQKRTISQIDQEQRRLEAEREELLAEDNASRKKRVQGQIPMPHGRPDRSNGGYSLAKEMQIDKHMMTLLHLQESVRTAVRTHLGKAFLDGETRYNKIGFQCLGAIAIDVTKEFPWLECDYEDVWPLDPLIRTTIENRKTVLRRRKRGVNMVCNMYTFSTNLFPKISSEGESVKDALNHGAAANTNGTQSHGPAQHNMPSTSEGSHDDDGCSRALGRVQRKRVVPRRHIINDTDEDSDEINDKDMEDSGKGSDCGEDENERSDGEDHQATPKSTNQRSDVKGKQDLQVGYHQTIVSTSKPVAASRPSARNHKIVTHY